MLIGITGTDGAGKGAVVDCLVASHGFSHYSVRDGIVSEIERQGLPVDRNQMRLTANALRAKLGNEAMVRLAYERAVAEGKDRIIIESVRVPEEVDYLRAHAGVLISVDADEILRFTRIQGRRSASDQVTFEQFKEQEALEMHNPDPHGQQKANVMASADYTIMNNGTIEELQQEIETFLTSFAK